MTLKTFNVPVNNKALDAKGLPKRIKVLSWGVNETNDGNVILNEYSAKVFMANQLAAGRDKALAIDFDHCSVPGSKEYVKGQPKAIAAYGDPELVEGDGIYLTNVEWTPMGEEFAKNYKDLSPAAVLDKNGVVMGLDSVGLVPHGAVRDLSFFSTKGFDKNMLKQMSSNCSEEYDAKDEFDDHDINCDCASCMEANDPVIQKKHVAEFDAEDHFSKYGDVSYADKENHKYPIDTKGHAKAAWSYVNMPKNAKKYSGDKLSAIKSRIRSAAKKFGIEIADEKTKTMSADNPSFPDAYKYQPQQYNTMNETIKKMAAVVGMEDETDQERVLFAFLAKYEGLQKEMKEQLTTNENTEEGGLKQFAATIDFLKKEIENMKQEKVDSAKVNDSFVRNQLIQQASREGKIVPLSADEVKSIDVNLLKSIVINQPRNVVPMNSTLRTLGVQEANKPSKEKALAAYNEMIASARK